MLSFAEGMGEEKRSDHSIMSLHQQLQKEAEQIVKWKASAEVVYTWVIIISIIVWSLQCTPYHFVIMQPASNIFQACRECEIRKCFHSSFSIAIIYNCIDMKLVAKMVSPLMDEKILVLDERHIVRKIILQWFLWKNLICNYVRKMYVADNGKMFVSYTAWLTYILICLFIWCSF